MAPPWGLVNDIKKDVLRPCLVPPSGLVYGCAAAEPPGPPYTLNNLPQPLKGCRRKVRIHMPVEVRDMVR